MKNWFIDKIANEPFEVHPDNLVKTQMKTIDNLQVANKVDDWLGMGDYELLQVWQVEDTWLIVARGINSLSKNGLYFLRVFPVGSSFQLSQDNIYDMYTFLE